MPSSGDCFPGAIADSSKGQAHSGKAECDSRQIVQEHSGYSDRMVPPAGSLRPLMCQVAHSSSGSLCNNLFIWGFTSLSTLYRSCHDG